MLEYNSNLLLKELKHRLCCWDIKCWAGVGRNGGQEAAGKWHGEIGRVQSRDNSYAFLRNLALSCSSGRDYTMTLHKKVRLHGQIMKDFLK